MKAVSRAKRQLTRMSPLTCTRLLFSAILYMLCLDAVVNHNCCVWTPVVYWSTSLSRQVICRAAAPLKCRFLLLYYALTVKDHTVAVGGALVPLEVFLSALFLLSLLPWWCSRLFASDCLVPNATRNKARSQQGQCLIICPFFLGMT